MHVVLRTENRRMTVFLFPIGLLFNSLLSFDEMNYKLLYVYCWRFVEKKRWSNWRCRNISLLYNMTVFFCFKYKSSCCILIKVNIQKYILKMYFYYYSFHVAKKKKLYKIERTHHLLSVIRGRMCKAVHPPNRNVLFLYNFNLINLVFCSILPIKCCVVWHICCFNFYLQAGKTALT